MSFLNAGAGGTRSHSQPHTADAVAPSTGVSGTLAAALLVVLAILVVAFSAIPARAGTINVWACHQPDGQTVAPADRWASNITTAGIHTSNSCAAGGAGYLQISVDAIPHSGHSHGSWKFTAPSGTTVTGFAYLRSAAVANWADATAFRSDLGLYDGSNIAESCGPPGCSWGWAWNGWGVYSKPGLMLLLEACAADGGCDGNSNGWYRIASAQVILEDSSAPTFSSLTGALTSGAVLRGNASLGALLADTGVGVYKLHATVDGRSFDDRTLDVNGGKCVPVTAASRNFNFAVPCPLTYSTSTRLDTSNLTDGQHAVDVKVEDAAGNTTTVFSDTIVTRNAPALVSRPEISGPTKVGSDLAATTGSWSPTPTGYAYQWLRCPSGAIGPADADSCVIVTGATRSTYRVADADVYGRVMVRVIAANASGSDSSVSAPSGVIADSQGRTAPPPPDDGRPRDVVIVPLPPGPGSSSSTTTIITTGSTVTYKIDGLKNPLAGVAGHVPNGTNATEGAHIRAAFDLRDRGANRATTVVRSTRNRRWVISGRLTNAQDAPIGGGQLVTAWQLPGRRWAAHASVKSHADGRFRYVLPAGPTRKVKFIYFPFSDSTAYNESNVVSEKVATPVSLHVAPRTARNGHSVKFTGAVATDFIPKGGVLVALEARYPGGAWKQFKLVSSSGGGRFAARYRFTRTSSATRYAFRARVARQAGYPFEGGTSRTTGVLVTP